jgi:aminoglycoside 6'-N-acetyltransferase I
MTVRPITPSDIPAWVDLRLKLWPEETREYLDRQGREVLAGSAGSPAWIVFVAEADSSLVGFLELSLRTYAEGCDSSPVPYVEGWYVGETLRGQGFGKALMDAAEAWSRSRGYTEMGSDALADNRLSRDAHAALGFKEVETLVVFRKPLPPV